MDFWSRLIGGAGSPSRKKPNPNSPQYRLNHFKATYNALLQIWHNGDGVSMDAMAAENARLYLHRASQLLTDDTRGPTPHLCVAFAATSRLLVIVSRIASAFHSVGITHEALGICSLLIDSEEEAFLEDRGFAAVLPQFVQSVTRAAPETSDLETESLMLEVLFGIASRIRLQPEILPVWFTPKSEDNRAQSDGEISVDSELGNRKDDFPLFYQLLYYVPAEGRAGEFARMGLLYLIESASRSESLEKWIVEGDMATLMASGLGALYSQLSRKLALSYTKDEMPSILAYSETLQLRADVDAEETISSEYQTHLATFLSSLVFWQDLLEHCTSADVKQTLLDHFHFLFLGQLLYPSLLESSDGDGGSSVAVLTYLRHILESIDHPDLIGLTLQYLFGTQHPASESKLETSIRPTTVARRRKSEDLLSHLANGEGQPSPDLFNLADLILASLGSKSQQTLSATLRLLSVMIRRQHPRTLRSLFRTRKSNDADAKRTVGGQEKEIDILLTMAENLMVFQGIDESYGRYLEDNRNLLESHPCSLHVLSIPKVLEDTKVPQRSEPGLDQMHAHTLLADDPILKSLLTLIESYFTNDIQTNLSLTQVLIDMAICSYTRLEGWLLTDPNKYMYSDKAREAQQSDPAIIMEGEMQISDEGLLHNVQLVRREPSWNAEDRSPLFAVLDRLVSQVESYRQGIPDFGTHFLECRTMIEAENGIDLPSKKVWGDPQKGNGSQSSSLSQLGSTNPIGSISERLRPERLSGAELRTSSPRGRQLNSSTPTLVGRLSHLHISPSRSSSQSSSRAYSPSPLRTEPVAPTPPKSNKAFRPFASALHRRIKIADGSGPIPGHTQEFSGSEASSVRSDSIGPETRVEASEVSLGHLLTNVVILQEFILELAALVDVRASLFDEVRFV